jgi:hypothetical protein
MHAAHSSSNWVGLPEVVEVAADGDFEPPHPDASNAKAATRPANNEQRTPEVNIVTTAKHASLKLL